MTPATPSATRVGRLSPDRVAVGLALLALSVVFVHLTLARGDFLSDDAWISMRYARNLVDGHGLLWNPGEPPVEGYSNLLWVLLAALGLALGISASKLMMAMGLGVGALCVPVGYATARAAGLGRGAGLAVAALVAGSGIIGATAASGLETPLMVLLMSAGAARLLWEERQIQQGASPPPWSALLFGLLAITHVEGPLYLAVPAFARLTRPGAGGPIRALLSLDRRDLLALVLLLAPPLGQELLRVLYYGDWMPNTVRVKTAGRPEIPFLLGARYVLFSLSINSARLAVLVLGVGAALLPGRGRSAADGLAARILLAPWVCCAVFVLIANGDMFNQFRFMAPAEPALLALAAVGWARIASFAPAFFRFAFLVVPLGLGVGMVVRDLHIQVADHDRMPAGFSDSFLASAFQVLRPSYGRIREFQEPFGRLRHIGRQGRAGEPDWFIYWILENLPVGDAVLFPDVGALGFALTEGRVLDGRGLNARGAAALLRAQPAEGPDGLQDPGVVAFLEEFNASNPALLIVQCSNGRLWGPVETALQASGALDAYEAVAMGRYTTPRTRVCALDAGRPRPTLEQILARYHRIQEDMPGVFDVTQRVAELQAGQAAPATQGLELDGPLESYPPGAWYRAATMPPP